MHKKRRHKAHWARLRTIIMEGEDDSKRKPKFCTTTSAWTINKDPPIGDLDLNHQFLGIRLRVPRESLDEIKPTAIKFRINNKPLYEPSLEGNDHRIYDVIQVCPKELTFSPPAEMTLRLPSCVRKASAGQVICMFGNAYGVKGDQRFLKWGRMSSDLFIVNNQRTEARVICKLTGFYTLVLTQCPEVTAKISPERGLTVHLHEMPGIKVQYDENTVEKESKITVKVVCLEDLYNSPSASPTSMTHRRRFPIEYRSETNDGMIDVTGSPVVLIRPIRTRFSKPVKLSLPLLGHEFDGFFDKESSRLVVLRSRELDDDSIVWYHHYSTPEVGTTSDNKKVATFLVTSGGMYKVVRRFPNKHMRFIEKVSSRISRELCHDTSPDVMVTLTLKGHITEIAEPGKQFVLRICLLDPSQPRNPDNCFVYEVCSQSLTVPLGKVRFLVRGRFEPDRDAADHSEERTVVFTGKTAFVDFNLKLRLSDPSKLPEHIGKVTVHSSTDFQYVVNLQRPVPLPKLVLKETADKLVRNVRQLKESRSGPPRPLVRRHTVSNMVQQRSIQETPIEEDEADGDIFRSHERTAEARTRKRSNSTTLESTQGEELYSGQTKNITGENIETQIQNITLHIEEENSEDEDSSLTSERKSASLFSKSCASDSHSSLRSDVIDGVNDQYDEDDWSEDDDVTSNSKGCIQNDDNDVSLNEDDVIHKNTDTLGIEGKEIEGDGWSGSSDITKESQEQLDGYKQNERDWSKTDEVTNTTQENIGIERNEPGHQVSCHSNEEVTKKNPENFDENYNEKIIEHDKDWLRTHDVTDLNEPIRDLVNNDDDSDKQREKSASTNEQFTGSTRSKSRSSGQNSVASQNSGLAHSPPFSNSDSHRIESRNFEVNRVESRNSLGSSNSGFNRGSSSNYSGSQGSISRTGSSSSRGSRLRVQNNKNEMNSRPSGTKQKRSDSLNTGSSTVSLDSKNNERIYGGKT